MGLDLAAGVGRLGAERETQDSRERERERESSRDWEKTQETQNSRAQETQETQDSQDDEIQIQRILEDAAKANNSNSGEA